MKVQLSRKTVVKGYSQLFGIDYSRIKARGKTPNTNTYMSYIDSIRDAGQSYFSEYRLVKETSGFIFREVITDSGISGHHKTVKSAIYSAIPYVEFFIDEEFEHQDSPIFRENKKYHQNRSKGCKHLNVGEKWGDPFCHDCGRRLMSMKKDDCKS